ncbi:hypothetical protein ACPW96_19890 [Micromonospora sp. DT81.3]|uniref:hypothetical protein n=1 Tax=Micromonospora sp. DT81.3 TaxID=3416523 RepID=UPI003CEB5D7C
MQHSIRFRTAALGLVFLVLAAVLVGQARPARAAEVDPAAQANAQALLASGRLTFGWSSPQSQVEAYAEGYEYVNPLTNRPCNLNDVLLDALKKVVVDHGFSIRVSSLNRWCEGSEPTIWWQYHIVNGGGHAIDIVRVNGVPSTGATPQDVALIRSLASVLPVPAGVGQYNCGQNFSLPTGWTRFNDTCDHLHVEYRGADVPPREVSATPVSVYRFWSSVYYGHFYTADPVERDTVISRWPNVWSYEGERYTAFKSQVPGTVPLYRFWSAALNGHFYTADPAERDQVISVWQNVWSYEGVAYFVYPATSTQPDTVPVARFWSPSVLHHFYTASPSERDKVISQWSNVWTYEGDNFRVPAAGVFGG